MYVSNLQQVELRKKQCNVTLFDCNHLSHVMVPWQMQKFMCRCTFFALFYFEFEGNFQVKVPRGFILRGDLSEGFLRYEFGGASLYLEGLIFGILRYTILAFLVLLTESHM